MMTPTWKAVIGVFAIFVLGWLAGALSSTILIKHRTMAVVRGGPPAWAQVAERSLTRNLGLDADQKKQIRVAFLDNVNQRVQLQKQIQPQVQLLNAETIKEINTILRPDQMDKFRSNLEYFRARAGRNFLGAATATDSMTNSTSATSPQK